MAGQQNKTALNAATAATTSSNPMDDLEHAANANRKTAFVPAKDRAAMAKPNSVVQEENTPAEQRNDAEIELDVDDDDDE